MPDQILNSDIIFNVKKFLSDFVSYKGEPVIYPLNSDGSQRRFKRFGGDEGGPSFILVENPPTSEIMRKENISYLKIGMHLFRKELPVPEIYRADLDLGFFILEDFGDRLVQDDALEGNCLLYTSDAADE